MAWSEGPTLTVPVYLNYKTNIDYQILRVLHIANLIKWRRVPDLASSKAKQKSIKIQEVFPVFGNRILEDLSVPAFLQKRSEEWFALWHVPGGSRSVCCCEDQIWKYVGFPKCHRTTAQQQATSRHCECPTKARGTPDLSPSFPVRFLPGLTYAFAVPGAGRRKLSTFGSRPSVCTLIALSVAQ